MAPSNRLHKTQTGIGAHAFASLSCFTLRLKPRKTGNCGRNFQSLTRIIRQDVSIQFFDATA
jgi:hypothetical protein